MPRATLKSGHRLPLVGLGTWKSPKGDVAAAVKCALQAGYRHIDCAAVYENEAEVGDALQAGFADGTVGREDVFVTSKLWNTHHAAPRVRVACLKSLQDLHLSYLDLYLVHWPVTGNTGPAVQPAIRETWEAMQQLVDEGLVRSIGVSNFSAAKLADILSYARIRPAACQVEMHPYWRNERLLSWCCKHGIHVTAYSPLGSPDSASLLQRKASRVLLDDPVVLRVAEQHGRTPGQVLIRWALQRGCSVLPKSTSQGRIAANLQVLDWELSAEGFAVLSSLPHQQRMVDGSFWLKPQGPYRTLRDLWDE